MIASTVREILWFVCYWAVGYIQMKAGRRKTKSLVNARAINDCPYINKLCTVWGHAWRGSDMHMNEYIMMSRYYSINIRMNFLLTHRYWTDVLKINGREICAYWTLGTRGGYSPQVWSSLFIIGQFPKWGIFSLSRDCDFNKERRK